MCETYQTQLYNKWIAKLHLKLAIKMLSEYCDIWLFIMDHGHCFDSLLIFFGSKVLSASASLSAFMCDWSKLISDTPINLQFKYNFAYFFLVIVVIFVKCNYNPVHPFHSRSNCCSYCNHKCKTQHYLCIRDHYVSRTANVKALRK